MTIIFYDWRTLSFIDSIFAWSLSCWVSISTNWSNRINSEDWALHLFEYLLNSCWMAWPCWTRPDSFIVIWSQRIFCWRSQSPFNISVWPVTLTFLQPWKPDHQNHRLRLGVWWTADCLHVHSVKILSISWGSPRSSVSPVMNRKTSFGLIDMRIDIPRPSTCGHWVV